MSIVKFVINDYFESSSIYGTISYILNPDKRMYETVGTVDLLEGDAVYYAQQMQLVKQAYSKCNGKQIHHLIISFRKYSGLFCSGLDLSGVWELAQRMRTYLPQGHQIVYAVHCMDWDPINKVYFYDETKIHIHYIINSVNWITGERLNINRVIGLI